MTPVALACAVVMVAAVGEGPTASGVPRIFQRRCVECHGPSKQSGKLRLDSVDAMFKGGRSGPAISAGKSGESRLFAKISAGAEKRMPPEGDPLAPEEIDAIRVWIDAGAKVEARVEPRADGRTAAGTGRPGSSPAGSEVSEAVELKPIPGAFRPVLCLAGEAAGLRLAVGRGSEVEILEAPPLGDEGSGGKAKEKGKESKDGKEKEKPSIRRLLLLRGHADLVQSIAFSPDGALLASGEFRAVRIWKSATGELLRTLEPHEDRVLQLAFSPDGARLATGGGLPTASGVVKMFEAATGKLLWSASPHSDTVLALAFLSDGARLFTGGADRVDYFLDAASGKVLQRLEGHTHHVLAVAVSPDGKRAVSASADRTARIWDSAGPGGEEEQRRLRGNDGTITSVAFLREGKRIITTGADGRVRLWNAENGNEEGSFNETKGFLAGGALLAGGKLFATAEEGGMVRVYDLEKRKLLFTLEDSAPR